MSGNNHHLSVHGVVDNGVIHLLDSSLMFAGMGTFNFSGILNISGNPLNVFKLEAEDIELSALFDQILKPFLRDTSLAEVGVDGLIDFDLSLKMGYYSQFVLIWKM